MCLCTCSVEGDRATSKGFEWYSYLITNLNLIAIHDAGFSDPYVRLGIIRAESRNKPLVKKHNLPDWDRKGLVLGKILHTSVIEKNLDPEWNEQKELYVKT